MILNNVVIALFEPEKCIRERRAEGGPKAARRDSASLSDLFWRQN